MYRSPFHEVYVDEGGLRETSTQCILITPAALKEFPQIIFSTEQAPSHPPHPHESRLPCVGAYSQCIKETLMLMGSVAKNRGINFESGP